MIWCKTRTIKAVFTQASVKATIFTQGGICVSVPVLLRSVQAWRCRVFKPSLEFADVRQKIAESTVHPGYVLQKLLKNSPTLNKIVEISRCWL